MSQDEFDTIEMEINGEPEAVIIWLHGLGADGNDFVPIVNQLNITRSKGVRFVFPHAPYRSVTINGGMTMRAWYDVMTLDRNGVQDEIGIQKSSTFLEELIQREYDRGIAYNKIIIAGFSQGGAIAIYTSLRYPKKLGGLIALSTWMPLEEKIKSELGKDNSQPSTLPIFLAHGEYDQVIPFEFGEISKNLIEKVGFKVSWNSYPIEHSVSQQEISDIGSWLSEILKQ